MDWPFLLSCGALFVFALLAGATLWKVSKAIERAVHPSQPFHLPHRRHHFHL